MASEIEERVRDVEVELWGIRGNKGLAAAVDKLGTEIDELRAELQAWRDEERNRRENEAQEMADERKKDRRWRLVFGVSVVSAILIAAGILAQAL